MHDPLDNSRFRLSAVRGCVDMQIALCDAEMRYRESMVGIAQKQVEIETDRERLKTIRQAKPSHG